MTADVLRFTGAHRDYYQVEAWGLDGEYRTAKEPCGYGGKEREVMFFTLAEANEWASDRPWLNPPRIVRVSAASEREVVGTMTKAPDARKWRLPA